MAYSKHDFKNRRSFSSSHKSGGSNFKRSSSNRSFNGFKNRRQNPYKGAYINPELFVSKAQPTNTESIYNKDITFNDLKLHQKVLENVSKHKYVHPTKIQALTSEHVMNKKDVLGLANTGSGKTAAFLMPTISSVLKDKNKRCLIIAPTRELVNQISTEFRNFSQNTGLRDVLIVGGASYHIQINVLKRDPHFVIATPGRLIDLFKQNHVDLSKFDIVILDEVDQMLDMGFIHDIKLIISKLKNPRQSLFFSATLNQKSREVANSILVDPVTIDVADKHAVKNVDQDVVKVGKRNKIDVLHEILVNAMTKRVLVFSQTKRGADLVAAALQSRGHKCDSLHGNKSLGKRTQILSKFKNYELDILVSTDVASRGIDIPDISHVINFDIPGSYEDYIHRIGRTGRIGKKGTALTFI